MSGSTLGTTRNCKDEEFYAGTRAQETTAYQVHACTIMVHFPGIAPQRQRVRSLRGEERGGGGGGGEVGLRFCKPRPFFETEIHYSPIYISVKSIPVFRLSEQNG